jgi:hypothetical protein
MPSDIPATLRNERGLIWSFILILRLIDLPNIQGWLVSARLVEPAGPFASAMTAVCLAGLGQDSHCLHKIYRHGRQIFPLPGVFLAWE